MDTEVETVIDSTEVVTPVSEEEIISIISIYSELESVATTESIDSLKSITLPSLEEVRKRLSVKSNSQSVKEEECELIDCGSTAGGAHLNRGDLMRAYRLRRYARMRFWFVNDTGDLIT